MDPGDRSLRDLERLLETTENSAERMRLIGALESDVRAGARKLAERARKQDDKARRQEARWRAFFDPERRILEKGFSRIAGVDEAGRGPLAGPVYAAAVILPTEFVHHKLDDSKRMTPQTRQIAYREITAAAIAFGTGIATVEEIERHNILGAVHLAVERALAALDPPADFALVDGLPLTSCPVPHLAIVKGDSRSRAIAAASVIAKVERDAWMVGLDSEFPGYGFASNKGYGTKEHMEAIKRLGPTTVHRKSFLHSGEQLDLMPQDGRESSWEWGKRAEEMVAREYQEHGYLVEFRRWRGGGGEIDLVCRRGDELVIVEIKASRSTLAGSPLGWLDSGQRRRMRSATTELLRQLEGDSQPAHVRFDLAAVVDDGNGPPRITRVEGIEP
ncbi:ribonuclease HII [Candidatus Zixiibacteriota bacterium]